MGISRKCLIHDDVRINALFYSAANKVTAKCPELTDEPDSKNNNTPLHVAALNNRTEVATILLLQVIFLFILF